MRRALYFLVACDWRTSDIVVERSGHVSDNLTGIWIAVAHEDAPDITGELVVQLVSFLWPLILVRSLERLHGITRMSGSKYARPLVWLLGSSFGI